MVTPDFNHTTDANFISKTMSSSATIHVTSDTPGRMTSASTVPTTESHWDDVSNSTNIIIPVDVDEFLQEKDDEYAVYVMPAIAYVAVLMIIGIMGNSIVLYVYIQKLKTGTYRWFVQAMATFDLLDCLIAMPGEIFDIRHNYTFGTSPFCQVFRAVSIFCSVASGLTLAMVALDRYKHVCVPLGKQITTKIAKILILVCAVTATITSMPAVVIYGSQTTLTDNPAINGSDCSTADAFTGTIYPMLFSAFHFLIFISVAVTLTVFYSLIGRQVCRQERRRRRGFGTAGKGRGKLPKDVRIEMRANPCTEGTENSNNTTESSISTPCFGASRVSTASFHYSDVSTAAAEDPVEKSKNVSPGNNNGSVGLSNLKHGQSSPTENLSEPEQNQSPSEQVQPPQKGQASGEQHNQPSCQQNQHPAAPEQMNASPQKKEASQQQASQNQASQQQESQNQASQQQASQDQASQNQASQNQASQNQAPQKQASQDQASQNQASQNQASQNQAPQKQASQKHVHSKRRSRTTASAETRRLTWMLFLVTLVFILSFLPYLSMMVVKILEEDSPVSRGGWNMAWRNIVLRSYFINSMANPIIYSFCSGVFRTECFKLLRCRFR